MSEDPVMGPHRTLAFPSRRAAETAFRRLVAAGFDEHDISLFVHARAPEGRASEKADELVDRGGAAGAGFGAFAGGIGGALASLGLLVIPGVGPMLTAGPVASAVTGAITGGAVGGFAGSLVGVGVSEAEAMAAEHQVKAGRALVIVTAPRSDARLAPIATALGGTEIEA